MKIITFYGFLRSKADSSPNFDSLFEIGSGQTSHTSHLNSDIDSETLLERNIESGSLMDVKNFASLKIFRSKSILNR